MSETEINKLLCTIVVAKMEKDEYACFCLFFLTHGGENMRMKTADDYNICIKQLTEFFKPRRCPGLIDKPKLFFIEVLFNSFDNSVLTFSPNVKCTKILKN